MVLWEGSLGNLKRKHPVTVVSTNSLKKKDSYKTQDKEIEHAHSSWGRAEFYSCVCRAGTGSGLQNENLLAANQTAQSIAS